MQPVTINRFPIFAAWCYVIAKRLGYSEDEARSLAVTRAKLGAAAKGGMLGTGLAPRSSRSQGSTPKAAPAAKPKPEEQVEFVGMRPFVMREGKELRGAMHQEHMLRPVRPREYDTSVVGKLGEEYDQVLSLLEELADRLDPKELNHRGYKLYEQFAPMVRTAGGMEATPRFGQRGVFDPAKVERLKDRLADAED